LVRNAGGRRTRWSLPMTQDEVQRGLRCSGALNEAELRECRSIPSEERLQRGAVVVIECAEEIPCNPCEAICPQEAIRIEDGLTDRPCVDFDACVGCRICVARCPGLAIFVVDQSQDGRDVVSIPYEFLPRPRVGEIVNGLDRLGRAVCDAEVLRMDEPREGQGTIVVTLSVPKGMGMEVRFIRLKGDVDREP